MEFLIPIKNGKKQLIPTSEHGFSLTQMETQDKMATFALEAEIVCIVGASANVSALSSAKKDAILTDFSVSFATQLKDGQVLKPYESVNLVDMREEARRQLEYEIEGYTDSTTGMAQAYVSGGNKTVTWKQRIPLGHIEFIDESARFSGLSKALMAASEYTCKLARDPFNAQDAGLSLVSCYITYRYVGRPAEYPRFSIVPTFKKLTNAKSEYINTPDGLVLTLEQQGALADTSIDKVTVDVAGLVVTQDPDTPVQIQARYEAAPDTLATEIGVKASRTPIYLVADIPARNALPGVVTAKQTTLTTDSEWDARTSYLDRLKWPLVQAIVKTQAAGSLKGNEQLLATNTATFERIECSDELAHFFGFTFIPQSAPEFGTECGLRVDANGVVEVFVPADRLRSTAAKIALAMMPSESMPMGNSWAAEAYLIELGREIPGFYAEGPTKDGRRVESYVSSQLREMLKPVVAARTAELQRAMAA